ncbi:MAG: ATP-binding protein [Bacteroidota bacterium]|nr:ATP-binding protein [Bacteroidota bacterium]
MKKIYPFKFLDSYTKDDTNIFFGRDEEINALYEMVFQTNILLVYGASGTGKTSLIQCGLASKFQSHDWLALSIRRGNNINEAFDKALLEAAGSEEGDEQEWLTGMWDTKDDQVSVQELSKLELRFKSIYLHYFRPIYLIFDQFEELYILGNKKEQDEFIENVLEILKVEQPVKMIFSIREEYLGHLDKFEKTVPQLLRKKLRVEAMNLEKVSKVIKGATHSENSNVRLKEGEESVITEKIFEKVRAEEKTLTIQLPYLQVFLDKLYMDITKDEKREAEAEFTMEALEKIGNLGDVLRDFLEEQVISISENLKTSYPKANIENIWKILWRFATLEGTKEPISIVTLQRRLPEINAALIDSTVAAFVNRRILKKSEKEDMYEITHDSLAQRIDERRSVEDKTLLEIVRLIKSQTSLKGEARELFSGRQLNYIEQFLPKLREQNLIYDDGEALIEQSRQRIKEIEEEEIVERERELKEAKERAEKESILRKDAETSQEKAVHSEKKSKTRSRYAAAAAILAIIIALAAIYFFLDAQEAKKLADRKSDSLHVQTTELEKSFQKIKYDQATSKAKELMSYGDSYENLEEYVLACESYSAGLNILQDYPTDSLYKKLEQKKEEVCKK